MNVNIMKTQIMHRMKYDLKGHGRSHKALNCILWKGWVIFITFRISDLITTFLWTTFER